MHQLRCFLAALFAILIVIASPACCCAAMVKIEKPVEPAHACCGHSVPKKEKQHDDCDCSTKTPRMVESQSVMPHAASAVFISPDISPLVCASLISETPAACFSGVPPSIDTGPPRLRLVMLQRFLI